MDILIKDKDIALDNAGNPIMVYDDEEKIQQALICITMKKGSFIYDTALGCDLSGVEEDEKYCKNLELRLNEAIIDVKGVSAQVLSCEKTENNKTEASILIKFGEKEVIRRVIL